MISAAPVPVAAVSAVIGGDCIGAQNVCPLFDLQFFDDYENLAPT